MPSERRQSVSLGAGTAAGAATVVAGYLLTYLWQADRLDASLDGLNALLGLLGVESVPTWKAVGWLLYGAHNVPVTLSLPGQAAVTRDLVAADGAPALLYLLPPALLVVAGFAVARHVDAREPVAGAVAGASLLPAYFALAVVGLLVTKFTVGDAAAAPALATGVLLAGIVYPALGGATGGVLGAVTR